MGLLHTTSSHEGDDDDDDDDSDDDDNGYRSSKLHMVDGWLVWLVDWLVDWLALPSFLPSFLPYVLLSIVVYFLRRRCKKLGVEFGTAVLPMTRVQGPLNRHGGG